MPIYVILVFCKISRSNGQSQFFDAHASKPFRSQYQNVKHFDFALRIGRDMVLGLHFVRQRRGHHFEISALPNPQQKSASQHLELISLHTHMETHVRASSHHSEIYI